MKMLKIITLLSLFTILIIAGGCKSQEDNLFIKEEVPSSTPIIENNPQPERTSEIIVEIKGAVVLPGVYSMKEGDRLNDLLIKAGGEKQTAELREVNLAEKIEDGASFYIPEAGEEFTPQPENSGGNKSKEGKINLNKATKEELMSVTGIGPATADNILAYREENGSFSSVDELVQVKRIGDKTLEKIRDFFTVK